MAKYILVRIAFSMLCFIVGIPYFATAQITLSSASYPSELVGMDSLKVTTYTSSFPSLLPATAAYWDMTTLTDSIPVLYAWRIPVVAYQYADSNYYFLGTYSYQGNAPTSIVSVGLYEYGINIWYSAYSLTSITLGPTDTFYIPEQITTYSSPLIKLEFPTAYNSSWQSSYTNYVAFELSVGAYSLLHEPGFVRTYTSRIDTVTGWGKMRVKNDAGSPSDYFDVLQVQSTTITTDSFFLNGVLAPPAILAMLNLTQGKKDTTYIQNYCRTQEVTPLARVEYKDQSFTVPFRATTHIQRLKALSSYSVFKRGDIKVYPNPLSSSRELFITVPYATGNYTYLLTDISGRNIVSGTLEGKPPFRLSVPANTVTELYYLQLSQNGIPVGTTAITIRE